MGKDKDILYSASHKAIPIDQEEYNRAAASIGSFTPKLSEWSCEIFGGGMNGITYQPVVGGEPNWFHRQMHRWILGFRWRKV